MQALFTLTPAESKRLIGKAIASLPEVQAAKRKGYLLIGRGSTNAYVIEEILKKKFSKERYLAGQTVRGVLCALGPKERVQPVTFHKGKLLPVEPATLLDKLGMGDILLKGANAIDAQGNVGVVMANPLGGTMGQFYVPFQARGTTIIYPVGLEKLVPSVPEASQFGGVYALDKVIGARVGLVCIPGARAFTEIEAIEFLFEIEAVHFASGGWGGAEGSVTLVVQGANGKVDQCLKFIEKKIKGEPPLPAAKSVCRDCQMPCSFAGQEEDQLPGYLKR